jgi:hypothetical protein
MRLIIPFFLIATITAHHIVKTRKSKLTPAEQKLVSPGFIYHAAGIVADLLYPWEHNCNPKTKPKSKDDHVINDYYRCGYANQGVVSTKEAELLVMQTRRTLWGELGSVGTRATSKFRGERELPVVHAFSEYQVGGKRYIVEGVHDKAYAYAYAYGKGCDWKPFLKNTAHGKLSLKEWMDPNLAAAVQQDVKDAQKEAASKGCVRRVMIGPEPSTTLPTGAVFYMQEEPNTFW